MSFNSCILFDEGKTGTLNQCIGLAKALSLTPEILSLSLTPKWISYLPRRLWPYKNFTIIPFSDSSSALCLSDFKNCSLIIAAGRKSTYAATKIKALSLHSVKIVSLMNPKLPLEKFDLVIAPLHDQLKPASNLLTTLGALSPKIFSEFLQEKLRFAKKFSKFSAPFITVCLGGPTKHLKMPPIFFEKLLSDLRHIKHTLGGTFLISPSRRTPNEIIKKLHNAFPDDWIWDETDPNPHYAFLGAADFILVTQDSISMLSEAALTKAPLYIYPLKGNAKKRSIFYQALYEKNIAKPFEGKLSIWTRPSFDEKDRIKTHPLCLKIIKQKND